MSPMNFKERLQRAAETLESADVDARYRLADEALLKKGNVSTVIRDTFSMPPQDYELVEALRTRAARLGRNTSKSEVVRAGLRLLDAVGEEQLYAVLQELARTSPGRKKRDS